MRIAVMLSLLALSACSRALAQSDVLQRPAPDSIVLERTSCFGICPAYRLRIDRSADVLFESRNASDSGAVSRRTAAAWVPDSLAADLSRIGFQDLPDQIAGSPLCPNAATDHPTITVTLFGQRPKRVTYYTGCYLRFDSRTAPTVAAPLTALKQFAGHMDTLTGAYQWIRAERYR